MKKESDLSVSIFRAVACFLAGGLFLLLSSSRVIGEALIAWGAISGLDAVLKVCGAPAARRRWVCGLLALAVLCGSAFRVYIGRQ